MMTKTGLLAAAAAVLPLASTLILETPTDWQSGTNVNISWTNSSGDQPTWSLELVNPDKFHNAFALSNNVQNSAKFLSIVLPPVQAGDGYRLQAVNTSDINDVYAQSGEFSIAAAPASLSASSTASGSYYSSSFIPSTSGSASVSASVSVTGSHSASNAASTSIPVAAAATSSTDTFNAASARFDPSLGSLAVMALAAVAGAVITL